MAQWGQGQPGFQYPVQTGFPGSNPQFQQQNPQFQQQNPQFQQQQQPPQFQQQNPQFQQGGFGNAGLVPQQTGFPGQRMQGFQQPQQTGFQGPGMMQAQPTGFPAQGGNFQQQPRQAPPPPVPPLPTQFQQQNQASGFLGLPQQQQPQVNRFLTTSPGLSGPGLVPQATGFPGRSGPLVPQMTGFVDPRLQMMSNTFMPLNAGSSFGAPSAPQLAPPQFNLQQSFQQHNQAQRGTSTHQMSWALSKAEKKQYNDIFRSWDAQSTGFISGQTALEVFGASGLPKDDLARIWTLADIDDRGKLNIAEFHVAMGLIYRRLSGMPVPEQLPQELVPPSARDLDNSVDMIKDLLKHESRARSPSTLDSPVSRLKNRSFNSSSSTIDSGRDATIYKHSDSEPPGGFYQSRSRHVNRDDVRARNETDSPSAELSDMKRMLANTAQMLERNAEADASRTAEDEALDREMDDLKYRVKRVSEDLEYVSQGPKTAAKDQERRKLERELLVLMHERVPEVERKIKARDERKEREKRQWARDRDRTNERFGRYDPKDESYSGRYDDRDRDRPYSRGGYDRDRDREREVERDSRDQDRGSYRNERSRSRERDYGRVSSPPPARLAPPPPSAPPSSLARDPPAPPRATPSPVPSKNMSAEERQAFARAEAKRRIEARMAALGVTAPSSSPTIDTSVEDRLLQEKKEAEERAKVAEKQAEERERLRNQRLESEKAATEAKNPSSPIPPPAAPPAPTPTAKAPAPPAPTPTSRPAPPPAPKRAPAPPPPRSVKPPAPRSPAVVAPPVAPAPPPEPEVDPEEEALRAREEAIRKQREARAEKLRQLEREEEEAARQEEERYQARLQALKAKTAPPPVTKTPAFTPAPYKPPTPPPAAPAAAAPPAPAVTTPAVDTSKSTNPFSKLIKEGTGSSAASPAATPATNGSTNPWAKPQTASSISAPAPPKSPVSATKVSYNTASSSAIDDDWEDIKENNEEDDSSDEDDFSGRAKRENIARQLFGGILPTSRPQSAAAGATPKPGSSPSSPAPPAPPPPPQPPTTPAVIQAQTEAPPAPPPPPPVAPVAPTPVAAAPAGDMSGLMRSIQGGMKLRPAKTVDKSAPPVSGRVLGDTAPPPHINIAPRSPTPPQAVTLPPVDNYLPTPEMMSHDDSSSKSNNRQSVGWFADRAADAGVEVQRLPSTTEEEEDIYGEASAAPIPAIHINEPSSEDASSDIMADIDKTTEYRARTLYPYEGDGPDDLSFGENLVLMANPSKSGGDWWHGTLISGGKSGVFPKTYVQVVEPVKARALYAYTGGNPDELPFTEGEELSIIDMSESEWWKTERGGVVFIVPAAYLEIVEAVATSPNGVGSILNDEATTTSPTEVNQHTHPLNSAYASIPADTSERNIGDEGDNDEDSDSSDYLSFDESDVEDSYPETKAEREARAHERQLVLQAAGLIVTQGAKPPPGVIRARSTKRRPPPAAPQRASRISTSSTKELPPVPEPEPEPEPEPMDHARRLDDAFDRYESFKASQGNRISVASTDTVPPSPTTSNFSGSIGAQSKEGESRSYSHFLNFLGRTKTPDSERRTASTLNISAPIMNNSEDSSRTNSPAFGTSWASLVDKTALEGIPSGERRRQETIFELITTEAAYVRDLQLIVEVFYSSMLPLLSSKEVTVVFANVEDILLTNTAFTSSLEERQKECRLYVDKIGDILLDHLPNMGVYMEYCVNQATAIKVLKSLRESNPALAAHLQRLRDSDPAVRNLDLSSYLLVPMQRITKYPLLIKQILSYTESQSERVSMENALHISEKLLDKINETIRDQEGRETLRIISQNLWIGQDCLDLTAPTRHMGPRKLIKEGPFTKAKSGRKLYGYLCSDILVLTDESTKMLYRMPIPLAQARIKEVNPGKDDLTFQVTQAYPRGGDAIALKATSVRDCQVWMHEIEYAGRRCRHAEDRAARKHRK